jgi:hypothetical protein
MARCARKRRYTPLNELIRSRIHRPAAWDDRAAGIGSDRAPRRLDLAASSTSVPILNITLTHGVPSVLIVGLLISELVMPRSAGNLARPQAKAPGIEEHLMEPHAGTSRAHPQHSRESNGW